MKENLITISSRLGVSVSTVSRVLNGTAQKYRISQDTIDRVMAESKRCGYNPNKVAQSLRKEKSSLVGILLPTLDNIFFSKLASVLLSELHKKGYVSIIMDSNEDEKLFYTNLMELVTYNVDGIIAVPIGNDSSLIEQLRAKGHRIVLVDRYYNGSSIPFVSTNNYLGALDATNYLISRGHTRIACIQGDVNSLTNAERVKGYSTAMHNAGLANNIIVSGNEFSTQNGYLEMKMLLLQDKRPTAIFSLSNTINLGVIKALREAQIKIGVDISIISYDSFTHMAISEPPITRIDQPIEDMAMLASKLLFCEINGESKESTKLFLGHTLIEGRSVFTIPAKQPAPIKV